MATTEQKKRLLKAKIAVALYDELGRVLTTEKVEQVFLLTRVMYKAGCERAFTDTASGSLIERPGLTEALAFARPGDTLVVCRLDRLGRSLRHFLDTVGALQQRGIGLRPLQE